MPFKKGSQEAREHMAKIRLKKGDPRLKNIGKKPKKEGIRSILNKTTVDVPIMGKQSIAVPEFFAVKRKNGYALVNPLTKARNLSSRGELNSIKLIRKPVDHMILMSHQSDPIPLSAFNKKDRETIDEHFKVVEEYKGEEIEDIPDSKPFKNAERGRPEKLPENIRINKERGAKKPIKTKKKKEVEEKKEEEKEEKEEKEAETKEEQKRTRTPKHKTDKERTDAIKKSKREWAKKYREELKKAEPKEPEPKEDPNKEEIERLEERLKLTKRLYDGFNTASSISSSLTGRRKKGSIGNNPKDLYNSYNEIKKSLEDLTGKEYEKILSPTEEKKDEKKNKKRLEKIQKEKEEEQAKRYKEIQEIKRLEDEEDIKAGKPPRNVYVPPTLKKKKIWLGGEGIGGTISAKDLKLLHASSYKKDKDKQVGDWVLDESISKPTATVYVNQKTKEPIVIHRGTEKTLSDWSNNLAYVMGKSKGTQRYKDSEEVQKKAEEKYGDTLTSGHSQGGIYSKLARNKKGIIDVNPASMGEVASEGTTIRSKSDPVSILAGLTNLFSSNKKNITTSGKTNPLSAHSIDILDELGDTQLGGSLRKKRGKGLLKSTKKVLGHLVSHITDMKEPVDKRDFEQAKMLIDGFKEIKDKKISGNGIMPRRLEEMTEKLMGCGVHHHHYHMGGMGVEGMLRDLGKYVQPTADASQDRAMRELKGSGVDWEKLARDLGKYVQPTADAAQDRAMRELKGSGFNDLLKMATMENLDRGVATIGKVNPLYPKVYDELKGIKGRGADWEKLARDLGKYVQPTADAAQDRAMRELRGGRLRKSKSESDSESDEEKPKRRGRMVKGSKEAMAWAEKMRASRRK